MLRIKEIAKDKGLKLSDIAAQMGIQSPALSRIIHGDNTTTDTLQRVADVLQVPIHDLFVEPGINCPHCGGKISFKK